MQSWVVVSSRFCSWTSKWFQVTARDSKRSMVQECLVRTRMTSLFTSAENVQQLRWATCKSATSILVPDCVFPHYKWDWALILPSEWTAFDCWMFWTYVQHAKSNWNFFSQVIEQDLFSLSISTSCLLILPIVDCVFLLCKLRHRGTAQHTDNANKLYTKTLVLIQKIYHNVG